MVIACMAFALVARILLSLIALPLILTPRRLRDANDFEWAPSLKVASLSLETFVSMMPEGTRKNAVTKWR
jgi:hypothetical protein